MCVGQGELAGANRTHDQAVGNFVRVVVEQHLDSDPGPSLCHTMGCIKLGISSFRVIV